MTTTAQALISGASDDLVEFDGAIYGEMPLGAKDRSVVTLKAPDGTTMRLLVEFGGPTNPEGWQVTVTDNPGGWATEEYASHDDEPDVGLKVEVPVGTKGKCDGKKVH